MIFQKKLLPGPKTEPWIYCFPSKHAIIAPSIIRYKDKLESKI